jgi:ribosomal protein S18 acetylase RimI-like enzyme
VTQIALRRLRTKDTPAFRALRLNALKRDPEFFGTDYADAARQSDLSFQGRIESALIVGAFAQDRLVGCAAFDAETRPRTAHRGWITSFIVHPEYQRLGIGSELLTFIAEHCRDEGILQMELFVTEHNEAAHALYTRNGFEIQGRSPRALRMKNGFVDELHMVRALDA